MADAVIVVRHPDRSSGRRRRARSSDLDAFDLAKASFSEALKRSASRSRTSTTSSSARRSRAAASSRATPPSSRLDARFRASPHNRHCASSLAPIQSAAASIRAGMDRVVIAGGAESLTQIRPPGQASSCRHRTRASSRGRRRATRPRREAPDQRHVHHRRVTHRESSQTSSREEQGEWAYHSHMRASRPPDQGRFRERDLRRWRCPSGGSAAETRLFDVDEPPRRDTTLEKLARCPPLHPEIDGFSDHGRQLVGSQRRRLRGRCPPTRDYVEAMGSSRWRSSGRGRRPGVRAPRTGLGPTLAIPRRLERAGLDRCRPRPGRDQRGVPRRWPWRRRVSSACRTRS